MKKMKMAEKPRGPAYLFFRDLWLHFFRRTRCILRRKHLVEPTYVGDLVKKGFRGVPMRQCGYCAEYVLSNADAKKFGGHI